MLVRDCLDTYSALSSFLDSDFSFTGRLKIRRNKQALQPIIDLVKENEKSPENEIKAILDSEVEVKLDSFTQTELEKCSLTQIGIELFEELGLLILDSPIEPAVIKKSAIVMD